MTPNAILTKTRCHSDQVLLEVIVLLSPGGTLGCSAGLKTTSGLDLSSTSIKPAAGSEVHRLLSILSVIMGRGPSLATLTLLISALHQCLACLASIGRTGAHGMLISLTSFIDLHCETAQGFDLNEPTQMLTYYRAGFVGLLLF